MKACRHCGSEPITRPRGLGWKCFKSHAIRRLYPPTSKYAKGSAGSESPRQLRQPSNPCPHPAGSPERIRTYAERDEMGMRLWHPEDSLQRAEVPVKGGRRR